MGFDDEGIVALSGAHTLGRAFQELNRVHKQFDFDRNSLIFSHPIVNLADFVLMAFAADSAPWLIWGSGV